MKVAGWRVVTLVTWRKRKEQGARLINTKMGKETTVPYNPTSMWRKPALPFGSPAKLTQLRSYPSPSDTKEMLSFCAHLPCWRHSSKGFFRSHAPGRSTKVCSNARQHVFSLQPRMGMCTSCCGDFWHQQILSIWWSKLVVDRKVIHLEEGIVLREVDSPPLPTTPEEWMAWETHDGRTGHLSNQGELGKVVGSVSRGCESSVDFHPQFAAFSNFMGVDPGADQIHTLVITTFLLALLPTLQTQIKEKVSGKHRLVFKS